MLGRDTFLCTVRSACDTEATPGSGLKEWVTMHGLGGTLATILFESRYTVSSVLLRTGHLDPRSLQSYQHLRGGNRLKQQSNLMNISDRSSKPFSVNETVSGTERPRGSFEM